MAIQLTDNEFYTGLTNLALFVKVYGVTNNTKVDQFVNAFRSEPLAYGDTKVFRSLPIPEVGEYSTTSSLLQVNIPKFTNKLTNQDENVAEESITVNQFKLIKSTYTRTMLELAVTGESGVNDFITQVINNMNAAKSDYLFNAILDALLDAPMYTESVTLDEPSVDATQQEATAISLENNKKISLAIQKIIDGMQIYSDTFNRIGLKQATPLSDLRLIVLQPYKNKAVVDLFAELLNSPIISENFPRPEMLTIPELALTNKQPDDTICFILHKEFLQIFDKLNISGNFYDSSNLCVNNFLHFWCGIGYLDQLPAVKIVKAASEPTPDPEPGVQG